MRFMNRRTATTVKADARAVEQVLIEKDGISRYGQGRTVLNKINSILNTKSLYEQAIQRGKQLLSDAGVE